MKIITLLPILFLLTVISCDNDQLCCVPPECLCDQPMVWVGVQYQDETGEDLLFGEEASYTIDDLTVESLSGDLSYSLSVDSTTTDFRYAAFYLTVSDTLQLTLEDHTPDTVAASTLLREEGCCGVMELTELQLNQSIICTACDGDEIISIKK